MKIYDISQEVFSCRVYPGDSSPKKCTVRNIGNGDVCNLTEFSMCAHNGTHIDAPRHFIKAGTPVDGLAPERFYGDAEVIVSIDEAYRLSAGIERVLVKGTDEITAAIAETLVSRGVRLLGVEAQSVGNAVIHNILLSSGMILLEGIVLDDVAPGHYTLSALPLNLGDCDGAPCRAILIDEK